MMIRLRKIDKFILRFVQLKILIMEKRDDDQNSDLILRLNRTQPSKNRYQMMLMKKNNNLN